MLVVRNCANLKEVFCHVNGAMYCQLKRPFQVLLFSTLLCLFFTGFLSSITNASRTFLSLIPLALSITCTLCQLFSCDPFLFKTCSAMADFSGWLSRTASQNPFARTSRALIVSPTYLSWQVSHFTVNATSLCGPLGSLPFTLYKASRVLGCVEQASDSSFPGKSSDIIAHSLKGRNLSCLPFSPVLLFTFLIFRGLRGSWRFIQLVCHWFLNELLLIIDCHFLAFQILVAQTDDRSCVVTKEKLHLFSLS